MPAGLTSSRDCKENDETEKIWEEEGGENLALVVDAGDLEPPNPNLSQRRASPGMAEGRRLSVRSCRHLKMWVTRGGNSPILPRVPMFLAEMGFFYKRNALSSGRYKQG